MKLYYSRGACSLAPRIIINELRIPCDFVGVDLKTKRTESNDDFLRTNPKGAVPTLELDSGEILTENAVILQYLAENSNGQTVLPAKTDFKHYRVLEWLNYVATELHKGFALFFNPTVTPEVKKDILTPIIKQKFNYLNQHLASKGYIFDNIFTLSDAYLFVVLTWAKGLKFDFNEWPNIGSYFEHLKGRNSIQRSLEQEGLLMTSH